MVKHIDIISRNGELANVQYKLDKTGDWINLGQLKGGRFSSFGNLKNDECNSIESKKMLKR